MRKVKEGNVIYLIPKDKDTMNLRDLIWIDTEDIKKPEMDKHLEKFRGLEDAMFDPKEELLKLAEAGEIEQNPLAAYSTTELKKELRRRKGKTK